MTMPTIHPAANLFPMLTGAAMAELVSDIREHGQRQPIVLYKGQILDGRNRWQACGEAGIEPWTEEWSPDGDEDPIAYVVSLNLHRRHLDESQRGMAAAAAQSMYEAEAKARQVVAGELKGRANLPEAERPREKAAALFNVSPRTVEAGRKVLREGAPELVEAVQQGKVAVSTAAVIAEAPKAEQREVVARGEREILAKAKEIRAAKNEERRTERVEKLATIARGNAPLLAPERFPILLADPPWRYEHVETESRAIENQYPTMTLDDICAMPVGDVTTADAVLFLWATSPKLAEAMRVVEAWGFTYRTCAVWVKDKIGMGYYFRQRHELLLVCTKGKPPVPAPSDRLDSVIDGVRGEHSAKPVAAYEAIERMYPTLPRMEMFCRSPRQGWHSWGNQAAA